MGKVRAYEIDEKERFEAIGNFYNIVRNLKTKDDVFGFFMGLFTPSEALMFARRIQIAQMLLEKKTYPEIRKKLGVGLSTITKVSHWLFGENEEFRHHILKNMERKKSHNNNRFAHEKWLEKYPEHQLIRALFKK